MRSYGQYCPMAMALEILGERWTLLIVRDLLCGTTRFNDLARGLPGISRALLAQRLRQLERAGLLLHQVGGGTVGTYQLTPAGHALQPFVNELVAWGARWAFGEPEPDHLDPVLLLWWMRRGVHRDRLPPGRVVAQFDFSGVRAATLWLLLERGEATVCLTPPGGEVDLLVTADLAALYRVWLGRTTFGAAQRAGLVTLDGPPALCRSFADWWALSAAAPAVRAVLSTPAGDDAPVQH